MKVKVKELTLDAFREYGSFVNMINPTVTGFGEEPCQFFRDMLVLGNPCMASFSICRVTKRPFVIETSEYHTAACEGILPLDSDVLIHVAPATQNGVIPTEYEVFKVPKGTLVTLKAGVWHHAPFAVDSEVANNIIVLPERTYANDCIVYELKDSEKIEIEI